MRSCNKMKAAPIPPRPAWRYPAAMLLAVCLTASAETNIAPVFHASWRAASEAATADQSLVLLVFSAEWCAPCQQLKKETLASAEFRQQAEPLHVADIDVDANRKLAHDFAVESIPTLILLTGDGKITGRHTGFVNTSELQALIDEGHRRADLGQWDGVAPVSALDVYLKKAAADNLTTNDLRQLVAMLGIADPGDRTRVAGILVDQREQAVPWLIDAVTNSYLGTRIGAADVLQKLVPDIIPVDPWQSPSELAVTAASLKKWWADTGKLPPAARTNPPDPALQNSLQAELETLRGDDPVRRTEAMSALAASGPAALPALRDAIRKAERGGDQRVIGWLEDVRWAILIPDSLEQLAGGVRRTLARGKSLERQSAAERLGTVGPASLAALTELVTDSDSMVAESAARALAQIGGASSIPAMAALLSASDNNLRMTAAQALGHTKNPDAVKSLLPVLDDPNELVAGTALAALVEARSTEDESPNKAPVPPEVTTALRGCLEDPRWRVRAAAAETAGKIGAHELVDDLKKLLGDSDGFVVQNTLAALNRLGSAPDTAELAAIAKRLPGLRAAAVEMMLRSQTQETVDAITDLFNASDTAGQIAVLAALSREEGERDAAGWELGFEHASVPGLGGSEEAKTGLKKLLTKAATSPDARLRRGAAEALRRQPTELSTALVGPLLADEDEATRAAASDVVLSILVPPRQNGYAGRAANKPKTNAPPASAAQMAAWHEALRQRTNAAPSLRLAAVIFATGDGKTDLPVMVTALQKTKTASARPAADAAAIELILSKLPWPDGKPIIDALCASPGWYAMAARASGPAAAGVADYLLDPARFKSALEPASGETLRNAMEMLAGYDYQMSADEGKSTWSLWRDDDHAKAVAAALPQFTNAAWRTAGIYALGLRADSNALAALVEPALADPNPWVRRAAIQALARRTKDRDALESRLGPMLSDTNQEVASAAAALLLEPEIRSVASLEENLSSFMYESITGGRASDMAVNGGNDERPLTTLEGKPAFLEVAAKRARGGTPEESAVFTLLLAQYGQFDTLDRLLAQNRAPKAKEQSSLEDSILAAIALSQDAKYLPTLRQMMSTRSDEFALRKVLQAMQGMRGAEARQLRLDINKKLRTVNSP